MIILKKSFDVLDFVLLSIILIVVIACITVSVKAYNSGSKSSNYKPICIKGHLYYRSNFMAKMGIAIALNDDGTPVKCECLE